ncbi:phage head closure protein [Aureimonas psammosilenae]|uniref:phage head closure protein n=1 Tax=Aureimonas psammosilenae TaxID=2495496 RepID=UPI001260AC4F|nr:phage head closure protein [Aureimonas psammosilenae]
MALLFIDPGLLNKRASLQVAERQPDGLGGGVVSWREVAEVSLHVEPLVTRPIERFDRREATITHRVICRKRGDVDRGMGFALGARRLIVRSVHDPDESGRWLVCRCEEEA